VVKIAFAHHDAGVAGEPTNMAKAFRQLHKMDDISADDLDEDMSSDLMGRNNSVDEDKADADEEDCSEVLDFPKKLLGCRDTESARRRRGSLTGSFSSRAFLHRALCSTWIFPVQRSQP